MMNRFYLPLAVVFLVSCDRQTNQSVERDRASATDASSFFVEEIAKEPADSTHAAPDSSAYIGPVNAFEETGEYYTDVFHLPHVITEGSYEYLRSATDSLIYAGEGISRRRIPADIAEAHFNLIGLESISVYNNVGKISAAHFVRVELLEDMIDTQFIAVFKPEDASKFSPDVSYCVSPGTATPKSVDVTWKSVDDVAFATHLLESLETEADLLSVIHVKTMPYNATYSGVNFPSKSYLVETAGDKSTVLKEINEDYYIGAITPLRLEINGKPVFLLRMGVNETDMVWTSLAVFTGKAYEFRRGNRIKGEIYL